MFGRRTRSGAASRAPFASEKEPSASPLPGPAAWTPLHLETVLKDVRDAAEGRRFCTVQVVYLADHLIDETGASTTESEWRCGSRDDAPSALTELAARETEVLHAGVEEDLPAEWEYFGEMRRAASAGRRRVEAFCH